jgi:hypothetical protein
MHHTLISPGCKSMPRREWMFVTLRRMVPARHWIGLLPGYAAIVLAMLAAPVHAAAQTTTPIPSTFFGVSPWYTPQNPNYPALPFGFLGHAQWSWAEIQRSPRQWDFSILEQYVRDAKSHGLWDRTTNTVYVAVTLGFTPQWAASKNQAACTIPTSHTPNQKGICASNPSTCQCAAPPDKIEQWAKFVHRLTQRYNGKKRPRIMLYELWNEADDSKWWQGWNGSNPLPSYYQCQNVQTQDPNNICPMVALARVAHAETHAVGSLLLTPSVTGTNAANWMRSYLAAHGDLHADGGAYHGYVAPTGSTVSINGMYPMPDDPFAQYGREDAIATGMRQVFDASKLAGKPMFQTEGSWGDNNVTDQFAQVAWLARYYLLQAGLSSTLNLQMVNWFAWDGAANAPWGVIQGTIAATAYASLYSWLVGATVQPCTAQSDGTWMCSLTLADGSIGVALWNIYGGWMLPDSSAFTEIHYLDGRLSVIPPGSPVLITAEPILLRGWLTFTKKQ